MPDASVAPNIQPLVRTQDSPDHRHAPSLCDQRTDRTSPRVRKCLPRPRGAGETGQWRAPPNRTSVKRSREERLTSTATIDVGPVGVCAVRHRATKPHHVGAPWGLLRPGRISWRVRRRRIAPRAISIGDSPRGSPKPARLRACAIANRDPQKKRSAALRSASASARVRPLLRPGEGHFRRSIGAASRHPPIAPPDPAADSEHGHREEHGDLPMHRAGE